MAEQPPPRKIGSLRDRIAAFENKGPAPAPAAAPAPRPKPAGVSWKPRATSPPPASADEDHEAKKAAGMSAADARESITKGGGGSLRERMAALQGLGGFGSGAPAAPPPRPASEKPKWKPPPVVSPPVHEDDEPIEAQPSGEQPTSPPADVIQAPEGEEEAQVAAEEAEEEAQEPDPEEEERQRRAAIAARMARLGGARVGMGGPPIFGKKPDVPAKKVVIPKVEHPKEEASGTAAHHDEHHAALAAVQTPPATESTSEDHAPDAQDYTDSAKAASSTSLLSADSSTSSAPRSPAMPVPAAPRRAAPPRRKTPKSPPAPHILDTETVSESPAVTPPHGNNVQSNEPQEYVQKSKEDEVALGISPPVLTSAHLEANEQEPEEKYVHAPDAEETAYASALTEALGDQAAQEEDRPYIAHNEEHAIEVEDVGEPTRDEETADVSAPIVEPEPEEDEDTRRKHIAERLRQQGGFNPFSAPPVRKSSAVVADQPAPIEHDSERVEALPSVERRQSIRHDSSDSSVLPGSPALGRRTSLRQESASFVPEAAPPVPISTRPGRRDSAASARSTGSEGSARHASGDGNDLNVNVNRQRMSMMSDHDNMQTVNEESYEEPAPLGAFGAHDEEARVLKEVTRQDDYDAFPEEGELDHRFSDEKVEEREDVRRRSSTSYGRTSAESERVGVMVSQTPPSVRRDSFKSPAYSAPPPPTPASPSAKRVSLPPTSASPSPSSKRASLPPTPASPSAKRASLPPAPASPSSKRASLPPPPRALPNVPQVGSDEELRTPSVHRMTISSPLNPAKRLVDETPAVIDDAPAGPVRRPSVGSHSSRKSIPPPPPPELEAQEEYYVQEQVAPPALVSPPVRRASSDARPKRKFVPPPPPPPTVPDVQEDDEAYGDDEAGHTTTDPSEYSEAEAEVEEEAPPPPPRRASVRVPIEHTPMSPVSVSSPRTERPPVPIAPIARPARQAPPPIETHDSSEQEILDDSDGDPIDPTFYSPQKSTSSVVLAASQSPISPAAAEENSEDEEQIRRRTIAERMAKLGGVRFGAPPLPPVSRPPPPPPVKTSDESEESDEPAEEKSAEEVPDEEEDEAARKQRIAARLASMGGMRFGMMPAPMSPAAPPVPKQSIPEPDEMPDTPRPPPARSSQLPAPPHAEPGPDSEDQSASDGVQIEAEESEIEEVNHEDVEDEAPPPPPRERRRTSVPVTSPQAPPVPPTASRPPIPTGRPPLPGAPISARSPLSPPPAPPMQSDYVIVEQAEFAEEAPRPPPPRTASQKRAPPPRSAPLPPPPVPAEIPAVGSSQWENTVDFGAETDLSLSGQWSDDSTQYPPSSQVPPPPPLAPGRRPSSSGSHITPQPSGGALQLSPDDLMAQWGRVGVQIHESATTLYETSRKSPIGDGTHIGFVMTVLKQIPNAMLPAPPYDSFGYLIYEQTGPSVLRRASDIMPGDVIVIHDAKLKGHKGLQMYHQNVGIGQPICAIVGDYEVKKAKVKVFQANQHVGQESVETASYRLEDLKSGTVKVFRVLEAQ